MEFKLNCSLEILSATPKILKNILAGLSDEWLHSNEGENTWSPHTVVGHLVFAEEVNWIPRVRKILSAEDNRFETFNQLTQVELYKDHVIRDLLKKFSTLRKNSLKELGRIEPDEKSLSRKGIHPDFGDVTLAQLLSAWTVHDLDHINQITRVLAKQYSKAVGPWFNYLGILKRAI